MLNSSTISSKSHSVVLVHNDPYNVHQHHHHASSKVRSVAPPATALHSTPLPAPRTNKSVLFVAFALILASLSYTAMSSTTSSGNPFPQSPALDQSSTSSTSGTYKFSERNDPAMVQNKVTNELKNPNEDASITKGDVGVAVEPEQREEEMSAGRSVEVVGAPQTSRSAVGTRGENKGPTALLSATGEDNRFNSLTLAKGHVRFREMRRRPDVYYRSLGCDMTCPKGEVMLNDNEICLSCNNQSIFSECQLSSALISATVDGSATGEDIKNGRDMGFKQNHKPQQQQQPQQLQHKNCPCLRKANYCDLELFEKIEACIIPGGKYPLPEFTIAALHRSIDNKNLDIAVHAKNDGVSHHILLHHKWEPGLMLVVQAALRKAADEAQVASFGKKRPPIFIDIGGNIGAFAVEISSLGFETHVFEMMPSNLQLLHISRCINDLQDKMHLYHVGLGRSEKLCAMFSHDSNSGDAIVACGGKNDIFGPQATNESVREVNGYTRRGWIQLQRLDDILETHLPHLLTSGRPIVMKIDVEGHEPDVLRGAARLLGRKPAKPKLILTEIWSSLNMTHFCEFMLKYDYIGVDFSGKKVIRDMTDGILFHKAFSASGVPIQNMAWVSGESFLDLGVPFAEW